MLDDQGRPTYSEAIEVGSSTDGAMIGVTAVDEEVELEVDVTREGMNVIAPITLYGDEALELASMLQSAAAVRSGMEPQDHLTTVVHDYRRRIDHLEAAIRKHVASLEPQDPDYEALRHVVRFAGFGGPA